MLIKSVAVLMMLSRIAAAEENAPITITLARTCVEATEGGLLDDAGRAAARQRLTRALEERDLFVVEGDCNETYRVEHAMAGRVQVIRISSAHGTRKWTDPDADKLLPIYRAMVASLIDGKIADPFEVPGTGAPQAVQVAPSSTTAPPAPFAVTPYPAPEVDFGSAPTMGRWYAALGGGGLAGANAGTSLAVGYRHHSSHRIIDVRGRLLGGDGGGNVAAGVGVYTVKPQPTTRLYAGGGLEISNTAYTPDTFTGSQMTGRGVAAFGTAGVQLGNEDSTFRPFIQTELTLPLYVSRDEATGQYQYPATFTVSFGFTR